MSGIMAATDPRERAGGRSSLFIRNRTPVRGMKMITLGILLITVAAVIAAGCTAQKEAVPAVTATPVPAPETTATPTPPVLPDELAGDWQLSTMAIQGGSAIVTPHGLIRLSFINGSTISGNGGCNDYMATINMTGVQTPYGNGMEFGPVGSTKKYCELYSSQESIYLSVLGNTMAYTVAGKKLILTDTSQNRLTFQRFS
jgi:heat shock protein HslJ